MKRVLVVRTGSAGPQVVARHGDFDGWFAGALRAGAAVDLTEGAGPLPDVVGWDGFVVTGSVASVTCPEPWMDALGAWLLEAAARQRAVLGVCFGHQLLARALGGRVERHPRGPEAGTVEVTLTGPGRGDPLFAGLPDRLSVQQSHEDHVPEPPPGAVVLAENGHSPVQAFAHGPYLRAVQFHPEFDAERCRTLCEAHRAWLDRARPRHAAAVLASIRETPEATAVLSNWLRGCVADRG